MFETNVGSVDRIIRLALGIILLASGIFLMIDGATLGYVLAVISIIPLATALMSTCPIYSIIGVSSCPAKANP